MKGGLDWKYKIASEIVFAVSSVNLIRMWCCWWFALVSQAWTSKQVIFGIILGDWVRVNWHFYFYFQFNWKSICRRVSCCHSIIPSSLHAQYFCSLSGSNSNYKNFGSVKTENLGHGEKPDYFSNKATVVFMKKENCMYKVRKFECPHIA